ncbi:MAG: HNH endonuclease [Snodgrassella sp.]|nr:HNH endonuclease [Snodgrassella sp.]
MKIPTLKSSLPEFNSSSATVLRDKPGATKRIRGYRWQEIKKRVLARDSFRCRSCGCIGGSLQVDHIIPLELGGSNDDSNLQVLCADCHKHKTTKELRQRYKRGW